MNVSKVQKKTSVCTTFLHQKKSTEGISIESKNVHSLERGSNVLYENNNPTGTFLRESDYENYISNASSYYFTNRCLVEPKFVDEVVKNFTHTNFVRSGVTISKMVRSQLKGSHNHDP